MDYEKKYKKALVKLKEHFTPTSDGIIAGISRELIEDIFPELKESEDYRKPNGGIVLEDFNGGDGFYKVNLAYLSKEQVEEIENIVNKWNTEPEESEDERIRKQIISFLKEFERDHYRNLDFSSWIAWLEKQSTPQVRTGLEWLNTIDDACDKRYAEEYAHGEYCHEQSFKWGFQEGVDWLEKQGEPTDINPSEFDLRLNKLLKQFEALPKEELASSLSFYLNVVQNDGTYKADEKQGDQKPANKVESKFHEGDWVVSSYGKVNQVITVDKDSDGFTLDDDTYFSGSWKDVYHLWTIQDAKPGDVLAAEDKDKIFIYNGKLDLRGRVCAYCGIYKTHDGLCFTECAVGNYFTYKEPYPATKEQRDTLIKAMADAGYTFDFDKKELKKIEPFDKYEGLTDFERTLADICIGWIGQELGWKQYIKDNADALLKIAIEKFNSVQDATFEQKPADWSEEDEEFLRRAIKATKDIYPVTADWLKSLGDRVQPKQVWSEENEEIIECLNNCLDELEKENGWRFVYVNNKNVELNKIRNWLKSLKPQNHWKPTEEQMDAVKSAALDVAKFSSRSDQLRLENEPYYKALVSLYNDLEKLKE